MRKNKIVKTNKIVSSVRVIHNSGLQLMAQVSSKVIPPVVNPQSLSDELRDKLKSHVANANSTDAAYFSQLQMPHAIEFAGFIAKYDRKEGIRK